MATARIPCRALVQGHSVTNPRHEEHAVGSSSTLYRARLWNMHSTPDLQTWFIGVSCVATVVYVTATVFIARYTKHQKDLTQRLADLQAATTQMQKQASDRELYVGLAIKSGWSTNPPGKYPVLLLVNPSKHVVLCEKLQITVKSEGISKTSDWWPAGTFLYVRPNDHEEIRVTHALRDVFKKLAAPADARPFNFSVVLHYTAHGDTYETIPVLFRSRAETAVQGWFEPV